MKKHSHLFLLCAGFFMLVTSCTRNDLHEQPLETPVVKIANEWLTSRVKEGETVRNERIELLRQSILPAKSSTETLEDGEKLIIIPIAAGFKMNTNSEKNADHYLLLFENKNKEVYKGNIVQFIPSNAGQITLPKNTLSRLWNCENVNANGTFTVLTIFDKHLYEVDFKDGKKTRYAEMTREVEDGNSLVLNDRTTNEGDPYCVEWYLETTTYYSDGTKESTKEYLGTTCYPGQCRPGEQCSVIAPEDYGGQPNNPDPDDEIEATKTLTWNVYNPYGPADPNTHSYGVNSIETIKGKKNVSAPQGGHFTKMWHNTSECNTCPQTIGVYIEDESKVSAAQQTASSRVKGHFTENGQRKDIDGSNTWEFKNVFK